MGKQFLIVDASSHFSILASDKSRINLLLASLTPVQEPVPRSDSANPDALQSQ